MVTVVPSFVNQFQICVVLVGDIYIYIYNTYNVLDDWGGRGSGGREEACVQQQKQQQQRRQQQQNHIVFGFRFHSHTYIYIYTTTTTES